MKSPPFLAYTRITIFITVVFLSLFLLVTSDDIDKCVLGIPLEDELHSFVGKISLFIRYPVHKVCWE